MSVRNDIAENFVLVVKDTGNPRFVLVTRAQFDPGQLSNAQFPCAYIEALNETRENESVNGTSGAIRLSVLTMSVVCFVKTSSEMMDIKRNEVIERIEEALTVDQTRGGVADYTELTDIVVENDVEPSIGKITLTFEVGYRYRTGEA